MGRAALVATSIISEALDRVMDPHFKVGLNDMGMVTNICVDDKGAAEIAMRCPCIGCPAWRMMQQNVKSEVGALDGISSVKIKIDWENPWTREDMSQAARGKAESHGYVI